MVTHGFGHDVPERGGAYDDDTAAIEPRAADLSAGIISLSIIRAALRRRKWLWRGMAMAGLLIGLSIAVVRSPAHQASATILLTPDPGQQVGEEMPNDVAMLQSRAVAERAMHDLGLPAADSLIGTYSVMPLTDQVLTLTVSGPSSSAAVSRANALAAEFLKFRAQQLESQQNRVLAALNQQITQARQRASSMASQVASVSAQPTSSAQQAKLKTLQAQSNQAASALTQLQQSTNAYRVTTQQATASMVEGSEVLDPAVPLRQATKKHLAVYGVAGLVGGLVLGLGLVIVLELASDRLRRREDVARALEAPVRLSVASVPAGRGRAGAGSGDVQRVVAHLRGNLPGSSRGAAALAVVAVDNAQAAAVPLVSLAVSCAQEGRTVVVADLSGGAHAAHLLSAGDPGVRTVTADGAHLVVAVPDRDDVVPVGPLHRVTAQGQSTRGSEEMAAAYASADLLLTLVSLDPSLGGEHLVTWATDAVVVVTAGQSSWTRLHAVGEMIRLAGTRLASAVLLGADKTDESLGTPPKPSPPDNVVYWHGNT
jgi:capsular polysaccharide biosynthesis protein